MADTLDSLLVPNAPPMTELEQPYVVYFLTARKARYPIKIGISGRHGFRHRLQSIQTAMPYDLVLLYLCPCDVFQFESEIHGAMAPNRLRGEWFKRNDEVMGFIRGIVSDFPNWRALAGIGENEWR